MLAVAYEYALDDIPTERLEGCFKRAVKAKADNFPVSGADIRNQWVIVQDELREQAKEHAREMDRLLMAGKGTLGAMYIDAWKALHNLPVEWKLGDPYPLESDLYGKQATMRGETYNCPRCKDARWQRMPAVRAPYVVMPKAVRCPLCNEGRKLLHAL